MMRGVEEVVPWDGSRRQTARPAKRRNMSFRASEVKSIGAFVPESLQSLRALGRDALLCRQLQSSPGCTVSGDTIMAWPKRVSCARDGSCMRFDYALRVGKVQ